MKYLTMAVIFVVGFVLRGLIDRKKYNRLKRAEAKSQEMCHKLDTYYKFMIDWMVYRQKGYSVLDGLREKNIKSIAIYGAKELCDLLIQEINGKIKIDYLIDRNWAQLNRNDKMHVYHPKEVFPPVDAIIVTPINDYKEIKKELVRKCDIPILSLRELINN